MLVGGLVLILLGANFLTDGASSVAKRWGVSELVIGLTIVAFGTSAPELAISVLSSLQGNAERAVGGGFQDIQHISNRGGVCAGFSFESWPGYNA